MGIANILVFTLPGQHYDLSAEAVTEPEMSKEKPPTPDDVIIVGAGVCGLASSLRFARKGLSVRLMESQALTAWGRQKRNVIVDSHSAGYLVSLGIEQSRLPPVKSMRVGRKGEPRLKLDFDAEQVRCSKPEEDIDVWLQRRDWVSIVALGELQHALLALVEEEPLITVQFETAALDIEQDGDVIDVTTAQSRHRGRFVLICDGGSRTSLSKRLKVSRKVHSRNRMSFAVAALETPQPAQARMGIYGDYWYGLFSSGETISCALPAGNRQGNAAEHLRELGYLGPLVEPPMEIDIAVTEADRLHLGERIVIAGDAAGTSDPRTGLGLQMALFWSDLVARHLRIDTLSICQPKYEKESRRANRRRVEGELALLNLADQAGSTTQLAAADAVIDFLKRIRLHSTLNFRPTDGRRAFELESRITSAGQLSMVAGAIEYECLSGKLRISQRADMIRLHLRNATIVQKIGGRSVGRIRLRKVCADLPAEMASSLLAEAYRQPLPATHIDLSLKACETLTLGPLMFRVNQPSDLRIDITSRQPQRISIHIDTGCLELLNLTALGDQPALRCTGWLKTLDALTGRRLHTVIDRAGAVAAREIRRIGIDRHQNGSCTVTLAFPFELRVALNREESEALVADMLSFVPLSRDAIGNAQHVRNLQLLLGAEAANG